MPAGLNSRKARLIRERLFMKQGGFCFYCLEPMDMATPIQTHPRRGTLDHIVPRSRGGTNVLSNLVLACYNCNRSKADQDEASFRKRQRLKATRPPRAPAAVAWEL